MKTVTGMIALALLAACGPRAEQPPANGTDATNDTSASMNDMSVANATMMDSTVDSGAMGSTGHDDNASTAPMH